MYKFIVTLVTRPANSLYLGSLAPSQKKVQEPKKERRKRKEEKGREKKKERRRKQIGEEKSKEKSKNERKGGVRGDQTKKCWSPKYQEEKGRQGKY